MEELERWEEGSMLVGKVRLELPRFDCLAREVEGGFDMQEFLWPVNLMDLGEMKFWEEEEPIHE